MKSDHEIASRRADMEMYWHTNARLYLVVMVVVVAVSCYLQRPDFSFLGTSAFTGVAAFVFWRLAMKHKQIAALIAGLVGITVGLLGMSSVVDWPLPILFTQGCGSVGASFSFCWLFVPYAQRS